MQGRGKKPTSVAAARWRIVGLCLGFGIGLAVQGWLFGIVIGGWLDERWNSSPWCVVGGIFLALLASFVELYRALIALEKAEKREKKDSELNQ